MHQEPRGECAKNHPRFLPFRRETLLAENLPATVSPAAIQHSSVLYCRRSQQPGKGFGLGLFRRCIKELSLFVRRERLPYLHGFSLAFLRGVQSRPKAAQLHNLPQRGNFHVDRPIGSTLALSFQLVQSNVSGSDISYQQRMNVINKCLKWLEKAMGSLAQRLPARAGPS